MSNSIRSIRRALVTTGNQAPLGAGNTVLDLAKGQVGLFDAETNQSLAAGGASANTKFYLGVGLNNGHHKSPGVIEAKNVRSVEFECYRAGVAPVYTFSNLCADCNSDYVIKFDVTVANGYVTHGMSPIYKTFVTRPSECCEGGGEVDCIAIIKDLRDQMNNDQDGLFAAIATNPANGAELDDAALDSWDVDANGCPNIQVTANAPALADFCNIPHKYSFPTGVSLVPSMQGFNCCSPAGVITETTSVVYPDGEGADVKYDEFDSAANAGLAFGPYRQTESGVPAQIEFNADAAVNYVQLTIEYDDPHDSGFLKYSAPKSLILAMPDDATNTIAPILTIVDAILGTALATEAGNC